MLPTTDSNTCVSPTSLIGTSKTFLSSTIKSASLPTSSDPDELPALFAIAPLIVKIRIVVARSTDCSGHKDSSLAPVGSLLRDHGLDSGPGIRRRHNRPVRTIDHEGAGFDECPDRPRPRDPDLTTPPSPSPGIGYHRIGHISAATFSSANLGTSSG